MIVDMTAAIGLAAQIEAHVAYRRSQERWGGHVGLPGDLAALETLYPLLDEGFFLVSELDITLFRDDTTDPRYKWCRIRVEGELLANGWLARSSFKVGVKELSCATSDPVVAAFAARYFWEKP